MAGNYNLTAERGETLSQVFTWKDGTGTPIDLTGYTAKMEVRTGEVANPGILVLTLTTANGRITLGDEDGTITLNVPVAVIDACEAGIYCYDLFLVSGTGAATRLLAGQFKLLQKVTQI